MLALWQHDQNGRHSVARIQELTGASAYHVGSVPAEWLQVLVSDESGGCNRLMCPLQIKLTDSDFDDAKAAWAWWQLRAAGTVGRRAKSPVLQRTKPLTERTAPAAACEQVAWRVYSWMLSSLQSRHVLVYSHVGRPGQIATTKLRLIATLHGALLLADPENRVYRWAGRSGIAASPTGPHPFVEHVHTPVCIMVLDHQYECETWMKVTTFVDYRVLPVIAGQLAAR